MEPTEGCSCEACKMVRQCLDVQRPHRAYENTNQLLDYLMSLDRVPEEEKDFLTKAADSFLLARTSFMIAYVATKMGDKSLCSDVGEALSLFIRKLRADLQSLETEAQIAQTLRWIEETEEK